jgi:hypothetical protein
MPHRCPYCEQMCDCRDETGHAEPCACECEGLEWASDDEEAEMDEMEQLMDDDGE